MSRLLEEKVKELIEKEKLKKRAKQADYLADKNYWETYNDVMEMLKSGQRLAKDSEYFAELKKVKYGKADPSYVLRLITKKFPHLVEDYKERCRKRLVEKVKYGKKEQLLPY